MYSFRLLTIFYVFALVGAGMATFGPVGLFLAALVLGFWTWMINRSGKPSEVTGLLVVLSLIGLLVMLLIPAVQSARGTAQRSDCMSNLKQIQLACLMYESVNGTMPPAYVADANGKPMHSWRVLLLPQYGDPALSAIYAQYNLNEPWNGPNNSKLAAQIPSIYQCPSHPKSTTGPPTDCHYFAVVDPKSGWPGAVGRPIRKFSDGTSMTVMVIEASGMGINWMEPRDLSMDEAVKLLTTQPRSGHSHVHDGFLTRTFKETSSRNVAFCDGSVQWMEQRQDAESAKALLTAAGRDSLSLQFESNAVKPRSTTVVKWDVVWGLAVFIVLALAPSAWLRRKNAAIVSGPAGVRVDENNRENRDGGVADDANAPAI